MSWITPKERTCLGQARRKQIARHEHGVLNTKMRTQSPLALLERSMQGRVSTLIPLKYQLMAQSPFAYFRGAVPVMAADLAMLPSTGIHVQLCGDAHVRNLGAYATADGRMTFDINDFDETIRGPFEWDLKRIAASLVLAGRESGHKEATARAAAEKCIARYVTQIRYFSHVPRMEACRFQVHRLGSVIPIHDALLKAEHATPMHVLEKLTELVKEKSGRRRRFKEEKPMLTRVNKATADKVLAALMPYRQTLESQWQHSLAFYHPVDVAFKVVGTGSVGLRDYCIYLEGNGAQDPMFLQMKEETASGYAAYQHDIHPVHHNGQRVVEGQRAMQLQSDPFLGWTEMEGRQYLVRQLNDHKGSIELEDLSGSGLDAYAEVCGELLARGHSRSGDPRVIAGYIGSGDSFVEALAQFGQLYADQTEKDLAQLLASGKAGKTVLVAPAKKAAKKEKKKSAAKKSATKKSLKKSAIKKSAKK